MRLEVHGARGSSPVSGPAFARYGGHTTCFEVTADDGSRLVVDAGSGLQRLQSGLPQARAVHGVRATVLLTHLHWDHIQGIPFFLPLFQRTSRIRFLAAPPDGDTVASVLDRVLAPPWFPVRVADAASRPQFDALPADAFRVGPLQVRAVPLQHPGGVSGYRIESGGRAVVVATDVEPGDPSSDARLLALARGADVLVHDAQYTPVEWTASRQGWGHATWEHATALAAAAGVQRLILTSHDPQRTDEGIDAILAAARRRFAATDAAFEGLTVELAGDGASRGRRSPS